MEMVDRISNLPRDLTDKILSRLPIREAAKTSVLSSNWRCKFAKLTDLVFDDRIFPESHTTFVNMVNHVLLSHIGPIYKFTISYRVHDIASRDIDLWILHLSRNSIKELILLNCKGPDCYNIPSCLFSCEDMTLLWLANCSLKPPPAFQGLRGLKTLGIHYVTLTEAVFENLMVCCPLLGKLTVVHCDGFTRLKIGAQNLLFLSIKGEFEDVSLENTLKLDDVSICLTNNVATSPRRARGRSSNLLKFFVHLPHVRRLCIHNYFLKYLAVDALPGNLPEPFLCLSFLSMHINFNNPKEILAAQCLLKSSPALREVEISARQEDQAVAGEVSSWLDDNRNFQFTQLRFVKLTGISYVNNELDFTRFLLSSSPVLERMTVTPATGFPELVKKLLQFRRASANAEVFYLDP